jgi:hypothetical protein
VQNSLRIKPEPMAGIPRPQERDLFVFILFLLLVRFLFAWEVMFPPPIAAGASPEAESSPSGASLDEEDEKKEGDSEKAENGRVREALSVQLCVEGGGGSFWIPPTEQNNSKPEDLQKLCSVTVTTFAAILFVAKKRVFFCCENIKKLFFALAKL